MEQAKTYTYYEMDSGEQIMVEAPSGVSIKMMSTESTVVAKKVLDVSADEFLQLLELSAENDIASATIYEKAIND